MKQGNGRPALTAPTPVREISDQWNEIDNAKRLATAIATRTAAASGLILWPANGQGRKKTADYCAEDCTSWNPPDQRNSDKSVCEFAHSYNREPRKCARASLLIDPLIIIHPVKMAGFDKACPTPHIKFAPSAPATADPADNAGLGAIADPRIGSR